MSEMDTTALCWFCGTVVPMSKLIAGYDTFDEQRLACLACNERMSGNWRPVDVRARHQEAGHNEYFGLCAEPECAAFRGAVVRLGPPR